MLQPPDDLQMLNAFNAKAAKGESYTTRLKVDDRVLARVTDGIYRHPTSALRELIANSYDADATFVEIQTDRPRFSSILIRDDGLGMTRPGLINLIAHIGGSAKRVAKGAELGVTRSDDTSLSPGGRKLIGKIGIGLFSVSQLTKQFTIVTKCKGANERLIAEVVLWTYSEDSAASQDGDPSKFETGEVRIKSVPATDTDAHGTEITLHSISPAARALLQSRTIWDRVNGDKDEGSPFFLSSVRAPKFHIGCVVPRSQDAVEESPKLPWEPSTDRDSRFQGLYTAVLAAFEAGKLRPSVNELFDNYLEMLWNLGLSVPLDYMDGVHPFDYDTASGISFFDVSSPKKGAVRELSLAEGESLRKRLGLRAPVRGDSAPFRVYVDDVRLFRPIRFVGLPESDPARPDKRPRLFVGRFEADVPGDEHVVGGRKIEFEAAILMAPRIVPKEHAGVLVRIADSSGTLFDASFMDLQVAEIQRLERICCEIFVHKGLDAALNIDRESFNFGHPHAKILMGWLHLALRQVFNTDKEISAAARTVRRAEEQVVLEAKQDEVVRGKLAELRLEVPPAVEFDEDETGVSSDGTRSGQRRKLQSKQVFKGTSVRPASGQRQRIERQVRAIARLLEGFRLLDDLDSDQQEELLNGIARILETEDER